MQKCAIEMALNEMLQNELSHITQENLNSFYHILQSEGDLKIISQALDTLINKNIQKNVREIKEKLLSSIASVYQRYFVDVADFVAQPLKYSSFDKKWREQKLQDALAPYSKVFEHFLRGLEFNEQKELMWKCLALAHNIDDFKRVIFYKRKEFCEELKEMHKTQIMQASNFKQLLEITALMACNYADNILLTPQAFILPNDPLQVIPLATQFLLFTKFFMLKLALYKQGIVDTPLQGGKNLSYFVHFTDESNLSSILNNGLLSRKELEKCEMALNFNDSRRYDNALDYISISITKPNTAVLNTFKNKGSIENPIYIYLDPFAVLSWYGCMDMIFCDKNAAARACNKGDSLLDFEAMFAPHIEYSTTLNAYNYDRDKDGREINEPTDPQAEILVEKCIPASAIAYILDSEKECIYLKSL